MARRRAGILVFPEVEVLDFAGPFEVLSVVRLDEARRRETVSPYEVLLVAETRAPLRATGGLVVTPDCALAECPPLDVLVVPGGWGTRREATNAPLLAWIGERARAARTVASVCTGAMLLGFAGLLDGRRATTHWRSLDWMREALPRTEVVDDRHVVWDGEVVTSAGISAGIDMAVLVVARHHGEAVARATARHMEYPYPDDLGRRVDTRGGDPPAAPR
jgi:transcriptional regulator GlxA family with amidase domain